MLHPQFRVQGAKLFSGNSLPEDRELGIQPVRPVSVRRPEPDAVARTATLSAIPPLLVGEGWDALLLN